MHNNYYFVDTEAGLQRLSCLLTITRLLDLNLVSSAIHVHDRDEASAVWTWTLLLPVDALSLGQENKAFVY